MRAAVVSATHGANLTPVSCAGAADSPVLFRDEEGALAERYAAKPTARLAVTVIQRALPHGRLEPRRCVRIGPRKTKIDERRFVVGDRRESVEQKSLDLSSGTYA